jgi:hypothetical protein
MGWYALVSLIADSRVKFLLAFVVVAVVIAGVLTVIEVSLKKKKARSEARVAKDSFVEKLKRYLHSDKSPKEKLDYLDSVAKTYFKEKYGTSSGASYSVLIEDFEKNKRGEFLVFCRQMFETYYSSKEIDNTKVLSLANEFLSSVKMKEHKEELSRVPSKTEKVFRVLDSFSVWAVSGFIWVARKFSSFRAEMKKRAAVRKITKDAKRIEKERGKQELKRQKFLAMERKRVVKELHRRRLEFFKRKKAFDDKGKKHEEELRRQKEAKLQEERRKIALREEEYRRKKALDVKAAKKAAKKAARLKVREERRRSKELKKQSRIRSKQDRQKRKSLDRLARRKEKELARQRKIALKQARKEEKRRKKEARKLNRGNGFGWFGFFRREKPTIISHPIGSKAWLKSISPHK